MNALSLKASPLFNKNIFFTPSLSIGYTLHATINYGFCLDFGIKKTNEKAEIIKYGFSFNQAYVLTRAPKQGQRSDMAIHRLRSFSLMGQKDIVNAKIGIGRARNKWGYGKHNLCIVRGINFDVNFEASHKNNIWLGLKQFRYNLKDWRWFEYPYTSIYSKYQFSDF